MQSQIKKWTSSFLLRYMYVGIIFLQSASLDFWSFIFSYLSYSFGISGCIEQCLYCSERCNSNFSSQGQGKASWRKSRLYQSGMPQQQMVGEVKSGVICTLNNAELLPEVSRPLYPCGHSHIFSQVCVISTCLNWIVHTILFSNNFTKVFVDLVCCSFSSFFSYFDGGWNVVGNFRLGW